MPLNRWEEMRKKCCMLLLLLSHSSHVRLCNPIDGCPPGSAVPGILQARTLEWVSFPSPMHESEKWKWSHSVVSDSLPPHGLQPTRLLHPWGFPGKSTGVGCHFLLWNAVSVSSVAQSCLTLCVPMNRNTPGLPVHHQLPEFILKLVSIKLVMPSSHLILCRPLLLLPPIPPSIRVFPNESTLRMRWPKYWSFSFSISLVKAMVLPVVMCGCESWTIKKAECWKIDAFELWCWRRLLRVSWTAGRSNQSILKEISPECSLEGLMLKLKCWIGAAKISLYESLKKKTAELPWWSSG